ncbi:MAG: hypothetical protein KVP17_003207 [Porospora cf. gigantea B]|uniref:uncharacterized protein n=1 Tax=Porospora cf. gigantea B TaxID=2853592 RepID=UPI003571F46B|nr:MAG: hypothetical protein KVP17_003207 [Porospora cf. gigantea B]
MESNNRLGSISKLKIAKKGSSTVHRIPIKKRASLRQELEDSPLSSFRKPTARRPHRDAVERSIVRTATLQKRHSIGRMLLDPPERFQKMLLSPKERSSLEETRDLRAPVVSPHTSSTPVQMDSLDVDSHMGLDVNPYALKAAPEMKPLMHRRERLYAKVGMHIPTEVDAWTDDSTNPYYVEKRTPIRTMRQHVPLPSEGSSTVYGGHDEAGNTAGAIKLVAPMVVGIPIPVPRLNYPWFKLVHFLLTLGGILLFFTYVTSQVIISETVPLLRGQNATVSVKDCGVTFDSLEAGASPYLHFRVWRHRLETQNFMSLRSAAPLSEWITPTWLSVRLFQRNRDIFFQCSVQFFLPPDFSFDSLRVSMSQSEDFQHVVTRIPVRAENYIMLRAYQAYLDLRDLEAPNVDVTLNDGSLRMTVQSQYLPRRHLNVRSRVAPVFIDSSAPLKVRMDEQQASRAMLRSEATLDVSSSNSVALAILKPTNSGGHPVSVSIVGEEVTTYISVTSCPSCPADPNKPNLKLWAGQEHLAPPHLSANSETRLKSLSMTGDSNPWQVLIDSAGLGMPEGMWHILSGYAYLGGNIWFALFSGGLLAPRTAAFRVHILGVFCRQEPSAINLSGSGLLVVHKGDEEEDEEVRGLSDALAHVDGTWKRADLLPEPDDDMMCRRLGGIDDMFKRKSMEIVPEDYGNYWPGARLGRVRGSNQCQGELLASTFKVLWDSVEDVRHPESLVVFKNDAGREVLFDMVDRTVMQKLVTIFDRWNFLAAIAMNCTMALVVAMKMALMLFEVLGQRYNEPLSKSKNILNNASCRVEHGFAPAKSARQTVIVTHTNLPGQGFCIRWVFKFKCDYSVLSLRIVFLDENTCTEITEMALTIDPETIKVVETLAGSQNEIFLPIRHPDALIPPGNVHFIVDNNTSWLIPSLGRFRVRLEALSSGGKLAGVSSWSPMCLYGRSMFMAELTNMIVERFAPHTLSSLSYFVCKHVKRLEIPAHPMTFAKFHLELSSSQALVGDRMTACLFWLGDAENRACGQTVPDEVRIRLNRDNDGNFANSKEARTVQVQRSEHRAIEIEMLSDATGEIVGSGVLYVSDVLAQFEETVFAHVHTEAGVPADQLTDNLMARRIRIAINITNSESIMGVLRMELDASSFLPLLRVPRSPIMPCGVARPRLQGVTPGLQVYQGSNVAVRWTVNQDFFRVFPRVRFSLVDGYSGQTLAPLNGGQDVLNSGELNSSVEVDIDKIEGYRVVAIKMTSSPSGAAEEVELSTSCCFYVLRALSLQAFELAYASFCRANSLEMEKLSHQQLASRGVLCLHRKAKLCMGLRDPLPFEPEGVVQTEGMSLLTSTLHVIRTSEDTAIFEPQDAEPLKVIKPITREVIILENCILDDNEFLWTASSDLFFLRFGCMKGQRIPLWLYVQGATLLRRLTPGKPPCPAPTRSSDWLTVFVMEMHETAAERGVRALMCYQLWPAVIDSILHIFKGGMLYVFPVQVLLFGILLNYVSTSFAYSHHRNISPVFMSDFLFEPTISFLWNMPSPYLQLLVYFVFTFAFWMWQLSFCDLLSFPRTRRQHLAYSTMYRFEMTEQLIRTVMTFWFFSMIVFWFFVGALVSSAEFLPVAVGLCIIAFLCLQQHKTYKTATNMVFGLVADNASYLFALCLENWFIVHDILVTDRDVTARKHDSTLSSQQRREIRKTVQLLHRRLAETDSLSHRTAQEAVIRKSDLVTYSLQKIVPSEGNVFGFDEFGAAYGVENELTLPTGTMLASVFDIEQHASSAQDLLLGLEAAMLKDGVLYGPRSGFSLHDEPIRKSTFELAIVCVPGFRPPEELDLHSKVCVIFESFNKDEDDRLREVEFFLWQEVLGKGCTFEWESTLRAFNRKYRTNVLVEEGASVQDLVAYYRQRPLEECHADYRQLMPMAEEQLEATPVFDVMQTAESEDESVSAESDDGDDMTERDDGLHSTVTLRTLELVFNHLIRQNTVESLDTFDFSPASVAGKVVQTQMSFYAGQIGPEHFKHAGRHPESAVEKEDSKLDAIWLRALAMTFNDTVVMLNNEATNLLAHMFKPSRVKAVSLHFYDSLMADHCGWKVRRILSKYMPIVSQDVHKSNEGFLKMTGMPKTTVQVLDFVQMYRLEAGDQLNKMFTMARHSGDLAVIENMQVGFIVDILLQAGVLIRTDVVLKKFVITLPGNAATKIELAQPVTVECRALVVSFIQEAQTSAADLTEEKVFGVITEMVSSYLWFSSFVFLIRLFGVDLVHDTLPFVTMHNVTVGDQSSDEFLEETESSVVVGGSSTIGYSPTARRNLKAIRIVFNRLSSNSGFLPQDLADEALLLLLDSRLNFTSAVACLKHLDINIVDSLTGGSITE